MFRLFNSRRSDYGSDGKRVTWNGMLMFQLPRAGPSIWFGGMTARPVLTIL
jgi:hypothetical protein